MFVSPLRHRISVIASSLPASVVRHSSSSASASASTSASTSFFWKNDQWSAPACRKALSHAATATTAQSIRFGDHEGVAPPSSSITHFRPVPELTLPRLLSIYAQLSKARLSALVVLSAMSSVALSPLPASLPVLLSTALGTTLCSASANTLNQIQEVPYDAQMARTRSRPLVRHAISPLHATGFALATGLTGSAILWTCVNTPTALLGAANIVLYAGLYTYLKRRSIVNTWVGAVVGAVPPLMGWTACGGHLLPSSSYPIHFFFPSFLSTSGAIAVEALPLTAADNPLSVLALFLLLYSWQFPHFNSLSYFVRTSYAQAGYQMLSVLDPRRNALVALRHAALLIPVCSVLFPLSGLTTWTFALTSLVPNLICTHYAWMFWRKGGGSEKDARQVFYASLWYLPVVMGLAMLHKNGLEWNKWFSKEDEGKENGKVIREKLATE